MKRNVAETWGRSAVPLTHEGARAQRQTAERELVRTVASCLLYEGTFYETGNEVAKRIAKLCADPTIKPSFIGGLAVKARQEWKLRHVPLYLTVQLVPRAKGTRLVSQVLDEVIQRPDELAEFLALYWLNGKRPLAAQVKKGLARAFTKFNAYQLAKWDKDGKGRIRLKDVAFLAHFKPGAEAKGVGKRQPAIKSRKVSERYARGPVRRHPQSLLGQLVEGTLPTPDTWEVALSGGADKREVFTRLLTEGKLGYDALLQNLRNMVDAGVSNKLIADALVKPGKYKVLPFRFFAAARHAPTLTVPLEEAMLKCIQNEPMLLGATLIVVDVSGSMADPLSQKSELSRMDAACALAVLGQELCENVEVFTFSNELAQVRPFRGFALAEAIVNSQRHGGTYLGGALRRLQGLRPKVDWVICITDEQTHDRVCPAWATKRSIVINVGSYAHGVQAPENGWARVSGLSERVFDWCRETEDL